MSGVASVKVSTLLPEDEYLPLQHRSRAHCLNEEGTTAPSRSYLAVNLGCAKSLKAFSNFIVAS
jgi:hypothetical protein